MFVRKFETQPSQKFSPMPRGIKSVTKKERTVLPVSFITSMGEKKDQQHCSCFFVLRNQTPQNS